MFGRRSPAQPKVIPAYGILIGRMIFLGGLALILLGVGFLVMLGVAGGSGAALLVFGLITVVGIVVCALAVRDLTGPAREEIALVKARSNFPVAGNPIYELKFDFAAPNPRPELTYNVTRQDFDRYRVGDRVLVRFSFFFKILIDFRPAPKNG